MAKDQTTPTVNPLDTVHMLLEMIQKQAPSLQTSVTNSDGSLNTSAGAAPISTAAPTPGNGQTPTAPPPDKQEPAPKKQLQASAGPQALTDAILNIGQIMPVAKPQLPQGKSISELLGGKSTAGADASANGAAVIQTAAKLLKLFAA